MWQCFLVRYAPTESSRQSTHGDATAKMLSGKQQTWKVPRRDRVDSERFRIELQRLVADDSLNDSLIAKTFHTRPPTAGRIVGTRAATAAAAKGSLQLRILCA